MISTEKLSFSTSLTVSETPSSATDPLAAMKRASPCRRAQHEACHFRHVLARDHLASPSTWPLTICPPSSSPALSARSRLIAGARPPTSGRGQPQGFRRRIDGEPGAPALLAGANHRKANAGTGDRGPVEQSARGIAAGDLHAMQVVGARPDAAHLADIGDNACKHGRGLVSRSRCSTRNVEWFGDKT